MWEHDRRRTPPVAGAGKAQTDPTGSGEKPAGRLYSPPRAYRGANQITVVRDPQAAVACHTCARLE